MAFYQEKLKEGSFITEFAALLKKEGWTVNEKFFKVGFDIKNLLGSTVVNIKDTDTVNYVIAQHQQATNSQGCTFGLARVYNGVVTYGELPEVFKTKPNILEVDKRKEMNEFLLTLWPEDEDNTIYLDNSKFYTYMAKKPRKLAKGEFLSTPQATARDVLDVEYGDYTILHNETTKTAYHEYDLTLPLNDPMIFQSPITEVKMRSLTAAAEWETNWWPDSKVTVNGWIDNEVAAVVIQCDQSPAPEDVVVPTIPLYWGAVESLDKGSDGSDDHVLFTGTTPPSPTYDFKSTTKFQSTPMLPINKKYPKYPSNSIDDVTVMRTIGGSYYQAHYVKAFNPPEEMEPDRKHDGKQFPTAWKNEKADEYTYPPVSSYTGKTDSSPVYITHPEERDRGELKRIIVAPSVGIKKHSHFKVAKGTCPETYDYYKCYDIDAISPLTKRPSTQYRPMMLAIYEGDTAQ